MKKSISILAVALAFVACNKIENPVLQSSDELGTLSVVVSADEAAATKAAPEAYTEAQTYESQVNTLQLFVFDSADSKLVYFKKYASGDLTANSNAYTVPAIEIKSGSYNVYALVNGPDLSASQPANVTALTGTAIALGTYNSTTAATGFVMGGNTASAVTVTASTGGTANITVKRYASRVALKSVTNSYTGGSITVKNAWIANVVANQTVAGGDEASTWDNPYSRVSGGTFAVANIISKEGKTADDASLTFKAINQAVATGSAYAPNTPDLFYGYTNSTATVYTFDAEHIPATWTATKTRIVVEAEVNGTVYYYPYDLSQFNARNKANTIAMVISGPGLDDPQDDPGKLSKKNLSVTVTVADWEAGESHECNY